MTEVGVRQQALRKLISSWNSSSSLSLNARVLQNTQLSKSAFSSANLSMAKTSKRPEEVNQGIHLVVSQPVEQDGGLHD